MGKTRRANLPSTRYGLVSTIKSFIRTVPDYPKPGILYRDVTGLLEDARGLRMSVDLIVHRYIDQDIDLVARV